ncbi:casein kinase 1 [Nematocida homosporus]|uniref:casein kinase 1 n=1 Tax=Nematocida homosporus TaxID=1912981 RepID=UPI00221EA894|nr:casein kinase 1 [Nematocida homosporus]KAI5187475.1 casein kinase 1 [Nematocida homosporus]
MRATRQFHDEEVKDRLVEPSAPSILSRKSRSDCRIPLPGDVLDGYILSEKIGQGSFGIVFEGHPVDSLKKVAIKIETYTDFRHSQLENEYKTYLLLQSSPGFPKVEYFGEKSGYKFLVMEYLGMSLEDMLAIRNRKFSAKTIFIVAKRMIDLIETLHSTGRVHRDLKPDNFLIGRDPKKLFLIDLGMAKEYIEMGQHIAITTGKRLTGTPRYASVNAHRGYDISRRDDLESIGYILVYLAKGRLPWQGLKESKREKYRIVGEMKRTMKVETIAKDLPGEKMIVEYFRYVKALGFDTIPDYVYLRSLLDAALHENGLVDDGVFEWEYAVKGSIEDMTANDSLDGDRVRKKGILYWLKKLFCQCLM